MPVIQKIADALHLHSHSTTFDDKVTIIFVLGGPGAGKGTQCARLVEDLGFVIFLIIAGDLLRAEQHREGSEYGQLIQTCIKEGKIVPMEVTVKLLENAMKAALADQQRSGTGWTNGQGRFLIDGFPRKMDQAEMFEHDVGKAAAVLYFVTTEEIMLRRILERGKTSGREDDNVESLKKRFNTYKEQTMPVIEHYEKLGKVIEIDSSFPIEEVHKNAKAALSPLLPETTA